ncbi:MAG: c-type cytochrome biogenesis protein CcmI [Endozoicomonas sp.]
MMQFWLLASVLVIAAAALVVFPLIVGRRKASVTSSDTASVAYYRERLEEVEQQLQRGDLDQDSAAALRLELEKSLVDGAGGSGVDQPSAYNEDRNLPMSLVVALLIPLVAVPLYFKLGAQTELAVTEAFMDPEISQEERLSTLEAWSEKRPENSQAYYLLGGRYLASGQVDKAVSSYRRLYELAGSSSDASALLAQALFLEAESQVTGEVRRLYLESLSLDPANTTALGIQGIDAFVQANYRAAVDAWSMALESETDPTSRQFLASGISKARAQLGESPAELRVNVTLAPELQSLPGNTRVIIFARESGGPRMPIAAVPITVSELPRVVILDDSSSMMMGGSKLSDANRLDIVARISLGGDVSKADYQAEVKSVSLDSKEVIKLMIRPAG